MALNYESDMTKFADEIQVNEINLDECALNQASLLSYYLSQKVLAERQLNLVKLKFDRFYAERYAQVEAELEVKEKRVTDKAIESKIKLGDDYLQEYVNLVEAQRIRDQLQACCTALVDRKKIIQQLLDARLVQAGGSVALNSRKSF